MATREWEGHEIPAPGRWRIDPGASELRFVARYLGALTLRMRFRRFSGAIEVGAVPADTALEAEVDAASLDTGAGVLNRILRAPRILDVEAYPHLRYMSTSVEVAAGAALRLTGDLTVRDVTRPVSLDVTYRGTEIPPDGPARARFRARCEIAHEEFLGWKRLLGIRSWAVGKRVRLDLRIEAVRER